MWENVELKTQECWCVNLFCLSHTLRHMWAAIDDVFLWLSSRATSLAGHLPIPINHELSCIVSLSSPLLLLSPPPPSTFRLSLNKLWHSDSDVCASEWCLAPLLIGKVLKCSGMKGLVMRLYFLGFYENVKKKKKELCSAIQLNVVREIPAFFWVAPFDNMMYNVLHVSILHMLKKISLCVPKAITHV